MVLFIFHIVFPQNLSLVIFSEVFILIILNIDANYLVSYSFWTYLDFISVSLM